MALGCGVDRGVPDAEVAAAAVEDDERSSLNESPKSLRPANKPRTVLRRSQFFDLSAFAPDPRVRLHASSMGAADGSHVVGLARPERCPRTAPRVAFHDSSSASLNSNASALVGFG